MNAHTQLNNIRANIFQAGINLLFHELCGDNKDVLHAQSVLGCETSCGRKSIAAMCSQDPLVRFQTPKPRANALA